MRTEFLSFIENNDLITKAHRTSVQKGFHDVPQHKYVPLLLILSEIREWKDAGGEVDRKLKAALEVEYTMRDVEVADIIIRLMDYAGTYGLIMELPTMLAPCQNLYYELDTAAILDNLDDTIHILADLIRKQCENKDVHGMAGTQEDALVSYAIHLASFLFSGPNGGDIVLAKMKYNESRPRMHGSNIF